MQLGQVIKAWRQKFDINMRDAAKIMDISPATLCRVEANNSVNSRVLANILLWLIGGKK